MTTRRRRGETTSVVVAVVVAIVVADVLLLTWGVASDVRLLVVLWLGPLLLAAEFAVVVFTLLAASIIRSVCAARREGSTDV